MTKKQMTQDEFNKQTLELLIDIIELLQATNLALPWKLYRKLRELKEQKD